MNEWKVLSTPVAGQLCHEVYRIKDPSQIMHAGNLEVKGLFATKEEAQALADKLNGKEKS